MPVYQWVGKNKKNEVKKGELEAVSEAAVKSQLVRQRITPTKIKKKPKDLFENVAFLQPKVKEKEIILFARQFSTMIFSGLEDAVRERARATIPAHWRGRSVVLRREYRERHLEFARARPMPAYDPNAWSGPNHSAA